MVVYNVTVKVDWDVHEDWLAWMRDKHIPDVLETGQFTDYRIFKLMSLDETDGVTYAIQYFCDSMEQYLTYQRDHAPDLQKQHRELFKDKFVAFRTLMKSI
jgi:hypothetical protein